MSERLTIAVDVDDVLAENAAALTAFSNERWGSELTPQDYQEDWMTMWRVDVEEAQRRVEEIYEANIIGDYAHIGQAVPVLGELSQDHRMVVITSRRESVREVTAEWIGRHFGGVFDEIHFAGIYDAGMDPRKAVHATKTDVCQRVGADYLIDDQVKHCVGAANAGIPSFLFGEYSWNARQIELPAAVRRVSSWQAIKEYFRGTSR